MSTNIAVGDCSWVQSGQMPNGATAYSTLWMSRTPDNSGYLYTGVRMLACGQLLYENAVTGSWKSYIPLTAGSHTFYWSGARRTTGDSGSFLFAFSLDRDGAGPAVVGQYLGSADAYDTGSTMLYCAAAQWGTLWLTGVPYKGTVDCSYWIGVIENYPPVYPA